MESAEFVQDGENQRNPARLQDTQDRGTQTLKRRPKMTNAQKVRNLEERLREA